MKACQTNWGHCGANMEGVSPQPHQVLLRTIIIHTQVVVLTRMSHTGMPSLPESKEVNSGLPRVSLGREAVHVGTAAAECKFGGQSATLIDGKPVDCGVPASLRGPSHLGAKPTAAQNRTHSSAAAAGNKRKAPASPPAVESSGALAMPCVEAVSVSLSGKSMPAASR